MTRYTFGEIAENIKDKRKPIKEDKDTYIGLEHLDHGSLCVTRWGSEAELKGDKLCAKKGDVLFGRRNTYLKRVAIAPFDCLFSAHGLILRPKEEVITKEYFPFFLSSDYFMNEAIRISVGSLSPTVNWSDLKELEFDLPPLEEQKRLADILWAAEELKQKYSKAISQLDLLKKLYFNSIIIKNTPPSCKLSELCKVITKGTTPTTLGFNFSKEGINFIKVENIDNDGRIDSNVMHIDEECNCAMKRSQLEIGDILFSIAGAVGRCAVVSENILPANTNQALAIIRLKEDTCINKNYLLCILHSSYIEEQALSMARGTSQLNLSLNDVANFNIPVLPNNKQQECISFVKSINELKRNLSNAYNLLTQVMHRLDMNPNED